MKRLTCYIAATLVCAGAVAASEEIVQIGDYEISFPSLSLDDNHVLHALYRHYQHPAPPIETAIWYENDGGTHYVGP